ncbi:MAG: hypothetical protein A3F09_05020 [Chlamydiae bacterium RIFCSPHIGHO2_12_FULL_49_11]|nr:MAG: hypothetical protein A3F09_05020 [Chlamydiae bacterium RIFCSPHIGHO2_12_FULL_49_11]
MKRFFGAVFLIAGTTIGVGMLGMPTVTGFSGFFPSLLVFFLCWGVMLTTALFFVEIISHFHKGENFITMAGATLGMGGRVVSWFVYIFLLYALMIAYISAIAPLFQEALQVVFQRTLPLWACQFGLPLLFGGFIYFGTQGVDIINRALMIGLAFAYILLVMFLPQHVVSSHLNYVDFRPVLYGIPVIITAFGYHIIIPSLYHYLGHDTRRLKIAVVVGGLVALILNLFWQFLVLGILPLQGENSLFAAWQASRTVTPYLEAVVTAPLLKVGVYFFSLFAIITSFLGVSLSLSDFLTDGLKLKRTWEGRAFAMMLTFIPPLLFVYSTRNIFLGALNYAGAFVAILLIFIPSCMILFGRRFPHRLPIRIAACVTLLFSVGVIVVNLCIRWGVFDPLLQSIGSRAV